MERLTEIVDSRIVNSIKERELAESDSLMVQHCKLINYLPFKLCPEWGGCFRKHQSVSQVQEGQVRFLEWCRAYAITPEHRFIHTLDGRWSPESCRLGVKSSATLGNPDEWYLGAGDTLVTMRRASKMLCVPVETLIEWKRRMILDHKVVCSALKSMLLPKSSWLGMIQPPQSG